jgi:hypothetical protein
LKKRSEENAGSTPHAFHHGATDGSKDVVDGNEWCRSEQTNGRTGSPSDGRTVIAVAKPPIQFIQVIPLVRDLLKGLGNQQAGLFNVQVHKSLFPPYAYAHLVVRKLSIPAHFGG